MPKRKFTIFVMPVGEGIYQAFSPFYPGCITDGDTIAGALAHAKDAMEGILEAEARDDGFPVPPFVHADHVVVGEVEVEVPASLIESPEKPAEPAPAETQPVAG